MHGRILVRLLMVASVVALVVAVAPAQEKAKAPEWSMNATAIEACSCPMFCQCYFNSKPAAHHDHGGGGAQHFCRANIAYRINRGHYGPTRLDGAKTINDLNVELTGLRQKSEPISPSLNERETQCLEVSGLRATELGSRR